MNWRAAFWSLALAGLWLAPSAHAQPAGLRDLNPAVRKAAANEAARTSNREAIPQLIALLGDQHADVRLAAVNALAALGAKSASRPMLVLAQSDRDAKVRQAAARAAKILDQRGFVAKLATADRPPVIRLKKAPESQRLWRVDRAVLVSSALAINARRADESLVGAVGAGLRWPRAEFQVNLTFPAVSLFGQVRLNLLKKIAVVPYLTWGFAIAFNNGEDRANGPSAAFFAGLGVRIQPAARFYFYTEAAANWVISQPAAPTLDSAVKPKALPKMTVPVIAGLGVEFWP